MISNFGIIEARAEKEKIKFVCMHNHSVSSLGGPSMISVMMPASKSIDFGLKLVCWRNTRLLIWFQFKFQIKKQINYWNIGVKCPSRPYKRQNSLLRVFYHHHIKITDCIHFPRCPLELVCLLSLRVPCALSLASLAANHDYRVGMEVDPLAGWDSFGLTCPGTCFSRKLASISWPHWIFPWGFGTSRVVADVALSVWILWFFPLSSFSSHPASISRGHPPLQLSSLHFITPT